MSDTITVNLSSFPENIDINLVETTLTFLQGAGLHRENVFTEDNTFEQDVTISGDLNVAGTTVIPHISGNTALSGNLTITGDESIIGNLSVTGSASVDNVTFDQTPELAGGVGVLRWNDTDGTLDLGLKGGNVTLQVGQEQIVRVVNKTNTDLLESEYKVVRIRLASEGGAQGQRLAVVLAQGDSDPDSVTTLGVVTENIANNQEGFITTMGLVRGINTTGSLQGETWVDGDVLYLSPTVAGGLTKVKPQAPNHTVTVAYVEYAHQNNGKLFVKIDNGYELDELHNVLITDVQNAQVLTYDSVSGVWKNADPTGGGGGDFLPLSGGTINGNLTVNGRLSADTTSSGLTNTVKGNVDILGTGSNRLLIDYDNTVTINGDSGVNINSTSGSISISANSNLALGSGSAVDLNSPNINLNTDTLYFNTSGFSYVSDAAEGFHRTALGSGATGDELFRANTQLEARNTLFTELFLYDANDAAPRTNPATQQNDDTLINMELTEGVWELSFYITFDSTGCGATPRLNFETPANVNLVQGSIYGGYHRGNQALASLAYNATAGAFNLIAFTTALDNYQYVGFGQFHLTGNTVMSLQYARGTNSVGTTVTRKGHSYIRARKITP
jgi:hypothetical protein